MTEFEKKFKEKAYGEVPSDFNEIKRKIIKENIEPMPAAEPESGKRMPRANIAAAIAAAIAVTLIAAFAVKGGIPRKIGAEQSSADAKDSVGEIAADTDDYFDSLGSEDFSDESAPKEYSVSSLAGSADRQPSSSGKTEGGKTSATSPSAETAGNEGKPSPFTTQPRLQRPPRSLQSSRIGIPAQRPANTERSFTAEKNTFIPSDITKPPQPSARRKNWARRR